MVERIGYPPLPQQNGNGEGGNVPNDSLPQEGENGGLVDLFRIYIRPDSFTGEIGDCGRNDSRN